MEGAAISAIRFGEPDERGTRARTMGSLSLAATAYQPWNSPATSSVVAVSRLPVPSVDA
jgi:hypothetical protein